MTFARLLNNRLVAPMVLSLLTALAPHALFAGGHGQSAAPAAERPLVDAQLLRDYLSGTSSVSLIDTRSPEEYSASHISGAVNIPFDALEQNAAALPADKAAPVVLYCRTGRRASVLKEQLVERGYSAVHVLPAQQIDRTGEAMTIMPEPK